MIRAVCSVFDSATRLYGQPFYVSAVGGALRSFADEVNRAATDNQLYQHPEDFELFWLANYDDETGIFEVPEGGARVLARGKDVKTA